MRIFLKNMAQDVDIFHSVNWETVMADEKKNEAMSDDELDQIIQDMSKEDELASAEIAPVAQAAEIVADPAEELKEEEPVENIRVLHAVKPEAEKTNAGDQSLKMELQGVVNLKVNFSSGGRSVELICSEEALVCRMADGTEFRIPLNAGAAKRNAA